VSVTLVIHHAMSMRRSISSSVCVFFLSGSTTLFRIISSIARISWESYWT